MAAVADVRVEEVGSKNFDSKPVSEFDMEKLVDLFSKLNPSAKEFFPTYAHLDHHHPGYFYHDHQFFDNYFSFADNTWVDDNPNNRRRRNTSNQGRRRTNGRSFRAQREDSIRRTVYVSDVDLQVTEEQLAALFSNCGQVIDCRICGDPHSVLRFAFVEFSDEYGARAALNLGGTMLGYYPVRVLPSKTAILPVNPSFLPRSDDEREMCTRTIYCTNIDKKDIVLRLSTRNFTRWHFTRLSPVSQTEVKNFFEAACGEVTRLRLLGDQVHSTCIAFVEFTMAESAILALNCSGLVLGSQPIRVSPSKTPVRPRISRPEFNVIS